MSPTIRGIIMMSIGITILSGMDGIVKWLMQRDITSIQLISIRGWLISLTLIVIISVLPRFGGIKALKTDKLKFHMGRSAIGVFAPMLFFLSLKYIPLADAVAIFFCNAFIMTAGSVWFLNEKVGIHRWSAVAVGFIGVMIALQPGTNSFHPASILVLISSISYASILISGRWLSRTESSLNIIFYFTFFNTIICSILLAIFWSSLWGEVQGIEMLAIAGISTVALIGYYFITQAITLAPIGAIAPIEYIALFWAVLIGYFFWGEVPTPMVWVGISIILSAGLYIGYREARQPNSSSNEAPSASTTINSP